MDTQASGKQKKGKDVQETILEWNDFEKLLHVATNNETEARYILTPDMMSNLYDWWIPKKQNIRLSFVSNKMYILFPDNTIRIGTTVQNLNQSHIEKYVLSIAIPLLHILHLIEDINRVHRHK